MKFLSGVVLILGLLMVMSTFTENGGLVSAGFGCPFNEYTCHNHCRSIGRRGGYCAGTFRQTCTCYSR